MLPVTIAVEGSTAWDECLKNAFLARAPIPMVIAGYQQLVYVTERMASFEDRAFGSRALVQYELRPL